MRPSFKVCLCVLLASGLSGLSDAQEFDLSFRGPDSAPEGAGGTSCEFSVTGVMTPSGLAAEDAGAQGWSLSITSDGAAITDITTAGTASADVNDDPPGLRNTGFGVSETTSGARAGSGCEGSDGAVSAIVLSFVMPITLPSDGPSDVVVVSLSGVFAEEAGAVVDTSVFFTDGCQGSGQPVDNRVTHGGNTVIPTLGSLTVSCVTRVIPACEQLANPPSNSIILGIQANSGGPLIFTCPEGDGAGDDDVGAAEIVSSDPSVSAFGAIVSTEAGTGVQGWSLSVGLSGDGNLLGATTDGTSAADANDGGLRNTGFEVSELVDPGLEPSSGPLAGAGPQGQGAVSAVVLSFTMPITLEPSSTETVLGLSVEPSFAPGGGAGDDDGAVVSEIVWKDGLQGSGQPVNNVATVGGNTVQFLACQDVKIKFVEPAGLIRCDPNVDGKSDIADAVFIVNELFRGGPAASCPDASDCNDDGSVDLSDATYNVAYRFVGGAPPPPPFGEECGDDPTEDELGDCTYECP